MSKRIMVVDDSRILHSQMAKILQDTDFEIVKFCKDGETGVEAYGEYLPDLVTVDIIMPGMDGLETSKAILEKWPDAKILVTSSLAYDETVKEAMEIGAKGFIAKPLKKDEVISTFNRALEE